MNILVTGSNGQLGRSIQEQYKNPDDQYFFTDIDSLDICNIDAIEKYICDKNIDLIINCAAYTNVEKAEVETVLAENVNVKAVENLAKTAKKHDLFLFHISTDYVFGGVSNTPITEGDAPNPQSVYGRTKRQGELAILQEKCNAIIIRTSWLYSEFGHNFVKTMLNIFDSRDVINVVIDQIGSPTYARDLAKAIVDIISGRKYKGREGIYHFSDEGLCSWYDFAVHIAKLSEKHSCKISPCYSSQFPSSVNRPAYSVLDKSKIKEVFGISVPYWADSLNDCINIILKNG